MAYRCLAAGRDSSQEKYMQLGITDQVRLAFQRQNRIPALVGTVLGSIPPVSAFCFSHFGLDLDSWRGRLAVVFVLACLSFSAPKVYRWSLAAFRSRLEAGGFAVLLEGAMTLADHRTLVLAVVSYVCLATLVGINAIVTACSIALDQKAVRAATRDAVGPIVALVKRPAAKMTAQRRVGAR